MKKLVGLLVGLLMVFGVVGSASALSFSDTVDFNGSGNGWTRIVDYTSSFNTNFIYTHSVDFVPEAASIDSASLSIRTWGANEQFYGIAEAWYVYGDFSHYIGELLGGNYWRVNTFDLDSSLFNGVSGNEWELQIRFREGTLFGEDMYIDWSTLSGEYSPVPEPATMLLFGLGLLGLAGVSRKKR